MSCTLHDVQLPQSASASITSVHWVAISWRRSTGAGLVNVGLRYRRTVGARVDEPLLEPVEEHVAARLGDVEQADRLALRCEAGRGRRVRVGDRSFAGGVEQQLAHGRTLPTDRRP